MPARAKRRAARRRKEGGAYARRDRIIRAGGAGTGRGGLAGEVRSAVGDLSQVGKPQQGKRRQGEGLRRAREAAGRRGGGCRRGEEPRRKGRSRACGRQSPAFGVPHRQGERRRRRGRFDYQSVCHCSKTDGAKSPLHGDGKPTWQSTTTPEEMSRQ